VTKGAAMAQWLGRRTCCLGSACAGTHRSHWLWQQGPSLFIGCGNRGIWPNLLQCTS